MDLITDRTAQDLQADSPKADYTISDINRVEASVEYLASTFETYGYSVNVEVKTNWSKTDIPTVAEMARYLANVQALVDGYYILPNTPSLPITMDDLNWQGANNIEQVLSDINQLVENMVAEYKYSGTFMCGEEF